MACARCSSPISTGDRFCPRCGAEVRVLGPAAPEIVSLGAQPDKPRPATPPGPSSAQLLLERLSKLSSEPKNKLAALALTGLGGALVLVAFFLPWAPSNGIAIGTTGSQPQGGAWAFDTPAGWPLFFISLLLLAWVASGEKLQEMMPGLAATIDRLTRIVAPLILGSGLLGVALLYLTLPWGCGGGLVVLALGACLLVAGSMVALFYPSTPPLEEPPA